MGRKFNIEEELHNRRKCVFNHKEQVSWVLLISSIGDHNRTSGYSHQYKVKLEVSEMKLMFKPNLHHKRPRKTQYHAINMQI